MKAQSHPTMTEPHGPTAEAHQPGCNGTPSLACVEDAIAVAWPAEASELWTHEAAGALGSLAHDHPELRREIIDLVRGIVRDRDPRGAP